MLEVYKGNLDLSELKKPEMLQYEYARQGLKIGLRLERGLGVNPYKFGMIGSTDSHTALSAVEEENFFGKHSGVEPNPCRASHPAIGFGGLTIWGWQMAFSSFEAVWATENTREALFDAMLRKVYDVVWSDGRKPDANGKLPPVGNTGDVANAIWTNTIGDPELIAVWKDPDFDPSLKAFYYARVIEIPTPRWTAYAVKRFGIQMPPEVPMVTQERAYTSPIWYTPG